MPVDARRLKELFVAASELPPAERAAYLERECGADAELRARLEALLHAHDASAAYLREPAPAPPLGTGQYTPQLGGEAALPSTTAARPEPVAGTVIAGRYTLVEKIGEGGMGEVWVTRQTEPVKRKVALKLIKTGMDSKAVVARFEQERQALAMMDHPNIAKVLDGGLTPEGRPFFVMELVNGLPLTRFCDEAKLTPRERLELFVPICQAVQHAHQKGIVHRDLKPANILVTLIDGQPVPKVIDFGVAKATAGRLTDESLSTHFGAVVGTLEYMAPEQAGFAGQDVDTRADIYSLGVILYELLTGLRPHDGKRLRQAALNEMLRILQEEEPSKPSTRLSTEEALPSLAALRHTEPRKLMALLRGELDWVVMKCLNKQRDRRYETANALARDLQRYLGDEPVEARPPSLGYRAGKFLRRNRGPAVAAALVAAAMLVGAAAAAWQAVEATRAKQEAVAAASAEKQARERAEQREAETSAVLGFVERRILAAARPKGEHGGLGREVTLRRAVEAALPFVNESFRDQPLVEARLRETLGVSFWYLGDARTAAAQQEIAVRIARERYGSDHPVTLGSMSNLAASYLWLGRFEEAETLNREVLELRKAKLGPDHRDTLGSMSNLASIYATLGRHTEALRLREEVLALSRARFGDDDPATPSYVNNLACTYLDLHRFVDVIKLLEPAARKIENRLGPDDAVTLAVLSNLGRAYNRLGRCDQGLRLLERVCPLQEAKRGPGHPDTLLSMAGLAACYQGLSRHADAVRVLERAMELSRTTFPPDHPDALIITNNLAVNYDALGRHADARKLLEETFRLRKAALGADHPDTLESMRALARCLIELDRRADALPIIEECLRLADGKAVDPGLFPHLRLRRAEITGDGRGCIAAAEQWETLARGVNEIYSAACYCAVAAAAVRADSRIPPDEATRLANEQADRAMAWLRQAVMAGWNDVQSLKEDRDLAALRQRDDFKKLLAELRSGQDKAKG